ncbi:MAG: hypothetical protein NVSMB57_12900 [Actinomycetota bacterium]
MKIKLIALAAVLTLAGTACGKSNDKATDTPAPEKSTSQESTPQTTPTGKKNPGTNSGGQGVQATDKLAFEPASLKVKKGASVTWTNSGSAPHTVTFSKPITFDSPLDAGKSVSYVFTKAGKFSYICKIHPGMKGTVTVS